MREIKFRYWSISENKMNYPESYWSEFKNCKWMQYIGLKDKNGKEIYEGDIVEGWLPDIGLLIMGTLVYDEMFTAFGIKNDAGFTGFYNITNYGVIGNIYE